MRKTGICACAALAVLVFSGCGQSETAQIYEAGVAAYEAEDYETAIADMEIVTEAGERLAEAYRVMGLSCLKTEAYPEAIAAFSRSLNYMEYEDADFEKDTGLYLALAREKSGDRQKAVEVCTELLKKGEDAEIFFTRGRLSLELGDDEQAASDFGRALEGCEDYNLYINIYLLYVEKNKSADGDLYLEQAMALEPSGADDYYQRGRIFEYQKNYTAARDELITAMQMGHGEAVLLLGRVYLEMEDAASARSMYQEYLNESEHDAQAYNGLALCDIYEGDYEAAMEKIQNGLAQDDGSARQALLYNEIVIYEYQNQFDLAKEKLTAYLEEYPDDEDAVRENAFLSTR